jgi:hypothetical protein
MKFKEIKYLVPSMDLVNDSLDVFVILEDDYCTAEFSYLVEVATPQFLSALMGKFESDFLPPVYPYIIVSKLTDEIIRAAIQAYIDIEDDSYWLKLYHILPTLEIEDINEILYRKKQENIELEAKKKYMQKLKQNRT